MSANRWGFALIFILIAVAGVALEGQRRAATGLRREIAQRRAAVEVRTRLDVERQQLAANQVSSEELERLRAERNAVAALHAEIERMKRRAESVARAAADRSMAEAKPKAIVPSIKDATVAANLWKNAGAGTPEAAFETALWAGAGGDIETLASLLAFDAEAGTKAEAIFANLPAAMQQELGTPQRLIALLIAKDVPLGSARIWSQSGAPTDTKISAELLNPEGKSKRVKLALRTEGESWRFIVSGRIVERYAARLQASDVVR